jgi:glycine cleavage system H lipoate-binding protein
VNEKSPDTISINKMDDGWLVVIQPQKTLEIALLIQPAEDD